MLGMHIFEERSMIVAEKLIISRGSKYGKHAVYTDGVPWYSQSCNFLHIK
ncbi:MAG: hypothetical protein MRJ93_01790 [Nitrososphaeraceae archaeon]|nr:hypothetical protein [Nitrososphaeraceae archaeon]